MPTKMPNFEGKSKMVARGKICLQHVSCYKIYAKTKEKTELLKIMLNKFIKKIKRFPFLSFEKYPQKIFNEDNKE